MGARLSGDLECRKAELLAERRGLFYGASKVSGALHGPGAPVGAGGQGIFLRVNPDYAPIPANPATNLADTLRPCAAATPEGEPERAHFMTSTIVDWLPVFHTAACGDTL